MNKKILIASFFAIIMLLIPFNAAIGASDGGLMVNGQDIVEESNPVIIEQFFAELLVLIDEVLLYFGHIPEVATICQEIIDIINDARNQILCTVFKALMLALFILILTVGEILYDLQDEIPIFLTMLIALFAAYGIAAIFALYFCDEYFPPQSDAIDISLADLTNINSLASVDISTLTNIVETSFQVSGCPCGQ